MHFFQIEPIVKNVFQWYGPLAHRWRWYLIVVPLFITLFCSTGFFKMKELRIDDPAFVFTPSDARWRHELKVFNENWPLDENKFLPGKSFETKRFVNVLIRAKDGGSIIRKPILEEIEILNKWIMFNISIPTKDTMHNLTYQDLCLNFNWVCGANEHIQMLLNYQNVKKVVDLQFPKSGTKDTPVYIGNLFGDVELNGNGSIKNAKLTQLFYFLKQDQKMVEEYSSKFSYAVEFFLKNTYSSELVTLSFAHYQSLEDGLDENAKAFVPNFVFSFFVLVFYALLSSFTFKRNSVREIDWIRSKPWLACAGMFTTVLSIVSAFGFLFLLGVHYNVINTIIPFLIIAIGIDDMFLMNACWDQTSCELTVPSRMSETLSHAGVAVTITNITDIMSFAIGCITDLPGIQYFCIYAFVSVAFSYFYQLTFFCGIMAVLGEAEKEKRHGITFQKTSFSFDVTKVSPETFMDLQQITRKTRYSPQSIDSLNNSISTSSSDHDCFSSKTMLPTGFKWDNLSSSTSGTEKSSKRANFEQHDRIVTFLRDSYGPFILSNQIRFFSVFLFFIYIMVALYGCFNFKEGLNPGNLVTNDHYIAKYFTDIKHFWKTGPQLHVAVLKPPALNNSLQRKKLLEVVSAFENTPYSLGEEGTVFFLREYLNYLTELNVDFENNEKIWTKKLNSWLKFTGGSTQWASNIRWNETDGSFLSFRFQIALKNFVEPNDHKHAAKIFREIADRQLFSVVVYHEAFPFADQYLIILPATIQNVVISLFCMTVVSILLVPSISSGFVIFVSIVSINIGVFGYMTLWGVNLDAVSMISIIMSIGFAVDLSAHIVYAFVTSKGSTNQKIIKALETLGWPIFQGASSTIAGISILYTVDAYIILTFFKTIWLTMFIGVVHGLLFIPVFLSLFPISFF